MLLAGKLCGGKTAYIIRVPGMLEGGGATIVFKLSELDIDYKNMSTLQIAWFVAITFITQFIHLIPLLQIVISWYYDQ